MEKSPQLREILHITHKDQTHLAQNKLHITELTILPQFAIVLMESTLWVAGELKEEDYIYIRKQTPKQI